MKESIRLQYLEAMGIDVWIPRHLPVAATQAIDAPSQSENVAPVDWVESSDTQHDDVSAAQEHEVWVEHRENLAEVEPRLDTNQALDAGTDDNQPRWVSLQSTQPKPHANDRAWKDLQHEVSLCRACSLCETRTQTVFGVGNKHATWLLIGEAPGQNEDLQGEPFVGRAGQLLTEMLRAIGLKREEVYIANMLKCRPPNNRDPQAEEVEACNGFLQRQIALLQPNIILAVGRIAAQNLLKTQQPLAKLRGIRHQLHNIPLIVIHHPAYLLRSLPEKAKAWEDLQFALSVYQELEYNHVETVT